MLTRVFVQLLPYTISIYRALQLGLGVWLGSGYRNFGPIGFRD